MAKRFATMTDIRPYGLYVHVPFCKSQCIYCNFSRVFKFNLVNDYIDAIKHEIALLTNKKPITSIYVGGGTPSAIGAEALDRLLTIVKSNFNTSNVTEFTIECNPEDIDNEIIDVFKRHNVNRISFGVQSLDDNMLKFMHRRHNSQRVYDAIQLLRKNKFNNISVDFIYGLPHIDGYNFEKDIDLFIKLDINHLSAYSLSYEEGSTINKLLAMNRITALPDDTIAEQYQILIKQLADADFDHYEISNFARSAKFSHHNWLYWQREPYYGLGPAACSFDGEYRFANTENVANYINALQNDEPHFTTEKLSTDDIYNEIVMLGLRTKQGISLNAIRQLPSKYFDFFNTNVEKLFNNSTLIKIGDYIKVPESNWFIDDLITRELFI